MKTPIEISCAHLKTRFFAVCAWVLLCTSPAFGSADQEIRQAIQLIEAQSYDKALVRLHQLEISLPDPEQLDNLLAVAYLGKGYQLLSANELPASREAFQNGRLYKDDDLRLWLGEAMTWFKEGRYAEAAFLLDQALGYAPPNADLYHLLGQAHYAQGRMPEAVDALTRAYELSGRSEVEALLAKVRREWQVEQGMEQESRGHFQLSFVDGEGSADLAKDILAILEDAYVELGSELDFYPEVMVPVLLYTRREYSTLTGSPDWSGGVYDCKIRLPLAGLKRMSEPFAALLYHEYMHVLVHFLANRNTPVWLNEGLAEMAGRRFFTPDFDAMHTNEGGAGLIEWQRLAEPFTSLEPSQVPIAYQQSYSLVRFMVDRYGWFKMAELLRRLGNNRDWQAVVAEVYQDYGLNWPAILVEWQAEKN